MLQQSPPQPLPIMILTGFLGAGKTTLLNKILRDPVYANSLVLVNEFGEIGIDHLLIEQIDGDMILLSSGCLCCTIRGDLISALEDILKKKDNNRIKDFDRVIIETTGLADPIPILQTLIQHPYIRLRFYLEGVVTVLDGVHGMATLENHVESFKQISVADHIIISKAELVHDENKVTDLANYVQHVNPSARVKIARDDDISFIRCSSLYDPATKSVDVQRWLNDPALAHDHHHHHHDVNRHNHSIAAFCLKSDVEITASQFDIFIEFLRQAYGSHLLRVKGIVRLADDVARPIVVHGVQHVFHPAVRLEQWPSDDHSTRVVFILMGLKPDFVEQLWQTCAGQPALDKADVAAHKANPLRIHSDHGLLS
jgi:G3E family GTPase